MEAINPLSGSVSNGGVELLPDIQNLNGRDRGKIKIALQNILQDYLYPD